jgi:hypothetical protein
MLPGQGTFQLNGVQSATRQGERSAQDFKAVVDQALDLCAGQTVHAPGIFNESPMAGPGQFKSGRVFATRLRNSVRIQ